MRILHELPSDSPFDLSLFLKVLLPVDVHSLDRVCQSDYIPRSEGAFGPDLIHLLAPLHHTIQVVLVLRDFREVPSFQGVQPHLDGRHGHA